MAYKFTILGSSSKGNCSLLETSDVCVLIDAGFSGKQIELMLSEVGKEIGDVDAVFLTHEHTDHAVGVRGLSRYGHLKFFANRDTAEAVQAGLSRSVKWGVFETGVGFEYGGMEVVGFSVPHDAYDPVGYVFDVGGERRLAWVTDLGYLPEGVKERVRHVEDLVLECNYDPDLLERDLKRPWSIKQRIQGRHGHLSNEDAYGFISETQESRWEQIYLAHLSRDCNRVGLVKERFSALLEKKTDYDIDIIDPDKRIDNRVQARIDRSTTREHRGYGIRT